ncbi:unnamed protein product [Lactuca saligna]|uniref:Protein SMG7 n=1 Tax=Lactuca saligna TaxID=75948 RepID=A0AA35Z8M1_LACSI|nr:unnamed protein product [Lactuca saligna]
MTIPMNNTVSNLSRERAQLLYNKNVELESKRRKAAQAKIPSDPNTWQQMRENYESILLEDHAFSEQHDIEYALWQLHYKCIEELRAHYSAAQAQNAKAPAPARPGPARITKIRSQFKTFLSEATGFYHDLMVKIRAKYGLSLGYVSDDSQHDVEMKKGLISCHRCFIYLGDLARYKGLYGEGDSKTRDFAAASSYYKQAATLWPSSGNPHHQLAILASYSGDELLAVYRYFRSLAVDTPFTTARDNLIIAFEKNRQSYCQLLGDSKAAPNKKTPARVTGKGRNKGETWVSSKDRKTEPNLVERESITMPETLKAFSIRFVRLNGILFTRTSLETFLEVFSVARSDFLQLLSSGQDEVFNFGSDYVECKLFITRFIAIMIFTVYNVNKKETEHQSYAEILQRSVVLQNAFAAIFDFMALILERCIQLNDPCASFLLPGIMIFVEWLVSCKEDLASTNEMEEKQVAARSLFWNQFVSFLNKLLIVSQVVNESGDETRLALPEDMELRGFLPLVSGQLVLDFTRTNYLDGNQEKKARVQRIVAAGKALSNNSKKAFYFDSKSKQFLFGVEPQNNNQVSTENIGQKLESEEEEDDEVIVFKPSVPEKHTPTHTDGLVFPSKRIDNPAPVSISMPPHEACASSVNENMVEQPEEFVENGLFSNLNLLGGKESEKHSGGKSSVGFQDSETIIIPSKFDSVMTSAAPSFGSLPSKTKPIKSPVSRPIRHYGPPPGFNNTVGPKYTVDEPQPQPQPQPLFGVNLRNGIGNVNQPVDDYSWLDGYQLPYSGYNNGIGIGNSWRCLPQPNKLLNTRKMSLGMESFPFPGKQVSSVAEAENGIQKQQNGNGGYQIPTERGNGNLQEAMQQQVKKGNEEFIALPQQYQGQSLWEARFFV